MSRIFRRLRGLLHPYVELTAAVALVLACQSSTAQSLRYVPVIYNVSLSSLNLLSSPAALAVDVHGAVYIVDSGHSRVWKTDVFGTTSLFAGKGTASYSGDNGLAVNAGLSSPSAIAIDVDGNVFIGDTNNFAIRRVDAVTGIITTIAGGNGTGTTGDGGLAVSAKFKQISGLAVDAADNLYVADATASTVRKISSTGVINLFAGGGTPATGNGDGGAALSAKLVSPFGVALDPSGNLLVADVGASDVRKVSTSNIITTFAGSTQGNSGMGGPAVSAKLNAPRAISVDSSGNVYIADSGNGLLTIVDSTLTINVLSGLGIFGGVGDGLPATVVQMITPYGVAVDSNGNVFVDSNTGNALYKVVQHPERFPYTVVGQSSAQQQLIVENTGSTTITISSVVASGDFTVGPSTSGTNNPRPCTASYGTLTTSTSSNWCTIDVTFTPTASGIRSFPLTVTSNDTPSTTIATLTSTGMSPTVAVSGGQVFTIAGMVPENLLNRTDNVDAKTVSLGQLSGLAFDSAGDIYISEYAFCDIRRVDAKTNIITTIAGTLAGNCGPITGNGGPATAAQFDGMGAMVIGPDNTIYVSDGLNNVIRSIDTQGKVHAFIGNGAVPHICNVSGDGGQALAVSICAATGLAMDTAGNLYFTEPLVEAIRKVSPAGIISTIAGVFNAAAGYSGDGGPATSANLNNPWSIVVDSKANVYFTDTSNNIVRRIDAVTQVITTVAGTPKVLGYSGDGGLATQATLNTPYGLAIDNAGNLYIGDSGNNLIRKVDAVTGIISTVAGNYVIGDLYNGDGLPATATGIYYPSVLAVDAAGTILYEDRNQLVRAVSPNGLIDFGSQKVGTTSNVQSVNVSNIGNTPLHFNSSTPYSIDGDFAFASGGTCNFAQALAMGASCTVNVQFTPTANYERYGTLNLNDDGVGSPQVTELRGAGITPSVSQGVLNPNSLSFPNQVVNTTSASQTIVLSNPGTSTLNISSISLAGANPTAFSETTTCGATLAVSANCNIVVTFTPSSVTSFAATVVVIDDAANSPQSATLTGTGTATPAPQAVLTPATLTFASQTVNTTSASQTLTLSNPGTATLNITGVTINGANATSFAANSGCGATLAVGATCSITVTFTPSTTGALNATVSVADNAANSPQTSTVSGTGAAAPAPQAVLTPSALSFASQTVGTTSASQTLTLTNPGNATLNITGVTVTGANPTSFAAVSGCGSTLAAGANCSITVTFTPVAAGTLTAGVTVADNAATATQTSTLTGTGVAAPDFTVAATPSQLSVTGGSTAQYNIALTSVLSSSPYSSLVTMSVAGLPKGATATFTPSAVTPGTTGASSVLSIITPRLTGALGSQPRNIPSKTGGVSLALLFLAIAAGRKRRRLSSLVLFTLVLGSLSAVGLTGCAGGFALPSASSPQTFTITVTGTNGSVQHSTTVTLTVN